MSLYKPLYSQTIPLKSYMSVANKLLQQPWMTTPNVKVTDIGQLNFKKMKDMGMEQLVISQNNTLFKGNFIDEATRKIRKAQIKNLPRFEQPEFIEMKRHYQFQKTFKYGPKVLTEEQQAEIKAKENHTNRVNKLYSVNRRLTKLRRSKKYQKMKKLDPHSQRMYFQDKIAKQVEEFQRQGKLESPAAKFISPEIENAFRKAVTVFGEENIILLSNYYQDQRYVRYVLPIPNEIKQLGFKDVKFANTRYIGKRPNNFAALQKYIKYEHDMDLKNTEKIVMIGDQLTTDILFGNENKMATVWVNQFKDERNPSLLNLCEQLHDIEKSTANEYMTSEPKEHPTLKSLQTEWVQ